MKLVLMWLLGVPLLVTSMVFAQSLAADQRVALSSAGNTQQCSWQQDLYHVSPVVTDQRHGVGCKRQAVQ
jgi:hypothetical protein